MTLSIDDRWRWWRDTLGSPRYVMAPMVLQSELAFRLLSRRHGCDLCYSPMLPAAAFLAADSATDHERPDTGVPATREAWFSSSSTGDRPLIVQLGGSDLSELLAVGRLVQDRCDGIDLNLGCPQHCAEKDGYGAFLLTKPERVRRLVAGLVSSLNVPITCKIRLLPKQEDTVAFATMLQEAGAAAVAVHGRLREQRHHEGAADLAAIAAVKKALRIPVIANGNVRTRRDAERCLAATGADAVMSGTAMLVNPCLFASPPGELPEPCAAKAAERWSDGMPSLICRLEMALEYLRCAEETGHPAGALPRILSEHVVHLVNGAQGRELSRLTVEESLAAQPVLPLLKAWRTVRTPEQYAALLIHLAARLGLSAQLGGALPDGGAARLLLGPVQSLAAIVLGEEPAARGKVSGKVSGAGVLQGMLRDLKGAERHAVNARLRDDLDRYNALVPGLKPERAHSRFLRVAAEAAAHAEERERAFQLSRRKPPRVLALHPTDPGGEGVTRDTTLHT